MTEYLLRRMSGTGDECSAVTLPELKSQLQTHLDMGTAAVRADSREMVLIGPEYPRVMEHIDGLVEQDAQRIEVLLIPNVCGGQHE